jgi:perosamine synthetase
MIPVFRPFVGQEEIDAVAEVLRDGWWGMGSKTAEFEARFADLVGAPVCLGTNSGTAALHLSLIVAGVEGREVIAPALTFVAATHAIVHAGATPVFADIDPETLTIDPADVEDQITDRTAAIVAMDYAGHPAALDELREIARRHDLVLIEDAAHAIGSIYRGRTVGSIADLTCFSFQAVKNIAMGEGGGITLADPDLARRLRRLRYLGLDTEPSERSAGRYRWQSDVSEIGFKEHLSDIPAAIGLAQLNRLSDTSRMRRAVVDRYQRAFADLEWLERPTERSYVDSSWFMYVVRVPDRDRFIDHLADRGVAASVHFKPNHLYSVYRPYARPLPLTESVWTRLVTLPLFPGLTAGEVDQVVDAVRSFSEVI